MFIVLILIFLQVHEECMKEMFISSLGSLHQFIQNILS
jgi:hypothetical protein